MRNSRLEDLAILIREQESLIEETNEKLASQLEDLRLLEEYYDLEIKRSKNETKHIRYL